MTVCSKLVHSVVHRLVFHLIIFFENAFHNAVHNEPITRMLYIKFICCIHLRIWRSKWVNLSQHPAQSLHYFGHTSLVSLVFKPFCCYFRRIQNLKLRYPVLFASWDEMVSLAMYLETVWSIFRWRFNLHARRWERHCCYIFVYVLCSYLLCVYPL
jgi:hypothetical protein